MGSEGRKGKTGSLFSGKLQPGASREEAANFEVGTTADVPKTDT